jgi:flagellar motor switch/type III secretory pathway protein FliN
MPFRTWLPSGALGGGAIDRLIEETTGQWSDHWFARRLMRGIGESASLDRTELGRLRDLQLRFTEGGLALALEDDAWMVIARMMLDEPVDRQAGTPADEQLVERLAAACVDDLCARLAAAFGLGRSVAWRRAGMEALPFAEARVFALGASDNAPTIRILVAHDLVASIVRSSAKPTRKPAPLRPLAEALSRQQVGLSAQVGRCELSLGEFAGLAPGDVLVLDAATAGVLPLAINGVARSGRCTVEQEDGRLRLKIVKPLTGTAQ